MTSVLLEDLTYLTSYSNKKNYRGVRDNVETLLTIYVVYHIMKRKRRVINEINRCMII